ncbi:hypothetical protein SAMN05660690_0623 [Geodermatophilus telluris]|uniref:Uncharacterized protein n=1 Tax=Geodermatophilus telluris TaxID=1190417 RepID=A0A1G6J2V2_9ACTN|nr:hypothetical protein [Geodermatophilus telluris]SDC12655.1 hypothetical protein SAMN05660690_0623 [Geodermatophilus telluris]
MARHAAADDAGTDPIVAAALARRQASASTEGAGSTQGTEGGLGWPGDTTTGGGLGWPGSTDAAAETARIDAVPPVPVPADDPGPPGRRGWRRLFGGRAA